MSGSAGETRRFLLDLTISNSCFIINQDIGLIQLEKL